MIKIGLLALVSTLVVASLSPEDRYKICKRGLVKSNCKNLVLSIQYSGKKAEDILTNINILRETVHQGRDKEIKSGQLEASYWLPHLTWSNDLAKQAHHWVKQCKPGLDECLKRAPGFIDQTRNSSITYGHFENPVTMVENWYYSGLKYFDRKLISKFNPDPETYNKVSNLTQMIWARITKVGCADAVEQIGDKLYKTTFICNWKQAGNMFGEYIFKIALANRTEEEQEIYDSYDAMITVPPASP
ncbi:hypothetical protein G9C98_006954 [Cotesia typhae]|uniref:SCP domain-containing protein n=1 Tax=Cotesia typhae TaxID=2053667 RepID=A0A8J5V7H7_9HYME|nr:hypothetical protein G9C98_006954 [Cotesia typhae]